MKRLLAIVIAIIAILAMSVPAMASDPPPLAPEKSVDTEVTVLGGSTDPEDGPIVLAKWETSAIVDDGDADGSADNTENGDVLHMIPGTQVLPTITLWDEGDTTPECGHLVYVWALVTGAGTSHHDIGDVDAEIFEPNDFIGAIMPPGSANVTADGNLDGPDYKYKLKCELELLYNTTGLDPVTLQANKDYIKAALVSANISDLLTLDDGYCLEDIIGFNMLVDQGLVELWRGVFPINHPQAGGIYHVEAYAYNETLTIIGNRLENCFDYVRVASLDKDFDELDWGDVSISTNAVICGDYTLDLDGSETPTVKSGGNCALDIWVQYEDMYNTSGAPMEKVRFDAFLFSDIYTVLETNEDWTPAPGDRDILDLSRPVTDPYLWLPICTPCKIGFSIHVIQALFEEYCGSVTLIVFDNGIPDPGFLCDNHSPLGDGPNYCPNDLSNN